MQAERSKSPLMRLVAAGEKLSNLAYHAGTNGGEVARDVWRAAQKEWDAAVRDLP
jgi:hypothetical protein